MNESSRQASLPAALPGGYGPPQPVGPGPGHLLGQEPWIPPPYMISGTSSSEFDSMRAGLFTSGFHDFNKHYPPYSYNYPTKGDGRHTGNGMDSDGGPPHEGLTARLLDKGSNAVQQPSHENVPTPPVPSREGTPAGNVGYRPWEQPPDGAPLDSAQVQSSPSAQQDKQGSGTATPGSRSGTPFRSQEYLSQTQLSDHGNSMDRTNTPNRPPSHMSSGPSPESHQDSQESLENDVSEKLQRLTPQQQAMCPPPLHMSSTHPSPRGTIQFGTNNISQFPPNHLNVYMQGQQPFPTSPGSQRFFPDPKRMKIEADSSTADFRGPLENSFQVPSVSSTTSRQQALPLPPMPHPPIEQWDSLPPNPAGLPANPDLEKVPKKKRKRCGECPGCMKKDNCGECGPCKSVRSHQICKMRKCDQLKTKKERVSTAQP
ncbi:cxxc5 [Cordylochernes scorpioides]|uniref:Cxxc5 n=1 Tax=Cordylochernes scorpioides TaxID=51811 RepID=A0ABY6LUG2_9ARAC|nr:cxxc5 [Cordylochernes scorpioides]